VAGISLGGFIIAPTAALFLENLGWRSTFLYLAALSFIIVLPPTLFIVRNSPAEMGLKPYGHDRGPEPADAIHTSRINADAPTTESDWTLAAAMRTTTFWSIWLSFCFSYAGIGTVLQHQIMHLNELGIPLTAAAIALGLTGAVGAIGKVAMGFICDKTAVKYAAAFCFALQALGIGVLLLAKSMPMIWVYVLIFGFAMGGQYALQPLSTVYFFGLRSFATLYGVVYMAGSFGGAVAPLAAAYLYDVTGSYRTAFAVCIAMVILSFIIILSTRKPAVTARPQG
jgi:sugar phosphate permease